MDDPVVGAPGGETSRKLRQAMSLVVDAREFARVFNNGAASRRNRRCRRASSATKPTT